MQDLLSMISALNRPRLLVRAARFGVDSYDRQTCLPRLLHCAAAPRNGQAIMALLELESALDDRRLRKLGDYTAAQHVAVLIALMGEARLLRATPSELPTPQQGPKPHMKASGIPALRPAT